MKLTTPKFIRAIAMLILNMFAILILLGNEDSQLTMIYLLSIFLVMAIISLAMEWNAFDKQNHEAYNSINHIKNLLDLAGLMQLLIATNMTNMTTKFVLIGFSTLLIFISLYLLKRKQQA